jgi:hypothetical protein
MERSKRERETWWCDHCAKHFAALYDNVPVRDATERDDD